MDMLWLRNDYDYYGDYVIVQQYDHLYSVYSNLGSITVKRGQSVTRGQLLGTFGQDDKTRDSHFHFEMRGSMSRGDELDAVDFIPIPTDYVDCLSVDETEELLADIKKSI